MPGTGVAGGVVQLGSLEALLRARPELLIGALAVLVALVLVVLLLRRSRRPPGVRLARALAAPDTVGILMHPNPDPDAMACAAAVGLIAERQGTEPTLYYHGEIRHQENRAFVTVLNLTLEYVEDVADIRTDEVVLVDHSEARGFPGAERIEPYALIDHHLTSDAEATAFTDIREDVGACASIVATYLQDLGWDPTAENGDGSVPGWVATGLVYGIQTDTRALTRGASPTDFRASEYLHPAIDTETLERIATPDFSPDILDIKARAISARDVRHPFAVSDVGTVSAVDAIPQAADELLRLEGVSAVVVLGDRNGTLHLSGRSRDDRIHMGTIIEDLLDGAEGSSGGGHARMGGGQCPCPADTEAREALVEDLFAAFAGQRS